MATITSHTLNGVDGSHAGGIPVRLRCLDTEREIFSTQMDAGGRLSQVLPPEEVQSGQRLELVFELANYWRAQGHSSSRTVTEIVLRFTIEDTSGDYHMPLIISPYSYSSWRSS
ncbi:MAG: hydroxyisourate hydrolase [Pseudomonadota bacterium]